MVEYIEDYGETIEDRMLALRQKHELTLQDLLLEAENARTLAKHQSDLDYLDSRDAQIDAQLARVDRLIDLRRWGEALYELQFRGLMSSEEAHGLEEVRQRLRRVYTGMGFGLLRSGNYQEVTDVLLPLEEDALLWHPSYYALAVAFRMTRRLDKAQWAISQAILGYQEQPLYFAEASRIWLGVCLTHARVVSNYIEQRNFASAASAKVKLKDAQERVLEALAATANAGPQEVPADLKAILQDIYGRLVTATHAIHPISPDYLRRAGLF